MSGEAKTVSELCREALELRGNAVPGDWFECGARYTFISRQLSEVEIEDVLEVCNHYRDEVQIEHNKAFIVFAANHIKQIAERCLELEKEVEILKNTNKAKKTHTKNCLDYLGGCICGSIERCSTCGSIDFAVARDMKSTRHCVHCSNNWIPGEAMKGGRG
nr:hypothetical protein BdHM001_18600 [Bdellovibrio sp. HM001]